MACHDLTIEQMHILLDDVRSWPEVMQVESNKDCTVVHITFWPNVCNMEYITPPTTYEVRFENPEPPAAHRTENVLCHDVWGGGNTHHRQQQFFDFDYQDKHSGPRGYAVPLGSICSGDLSEQMDGTHFDNTNPVFCFQQVRQWHVGMMYGHRYHPPWWKKHNEEFLSRADIRLLIPPQITGDFVHVCPLKLDMFVDANNGSANMAKVRAAVIAGPKSVAQ